MAATFPSDWREQPCFVTAIPRPLVPYVSGLLKILEQRGFWASSDDYQDGYTATIELEECLMTTCLDVLIQQSEATYRLLNTALLGQAYTVVSESPLVVTPAIAPAVDLTILNEDSLIGRLDRLNKLVDNSVNGTINDQYSYSPSVKDLLQAVIDAISSETTDLSSILTELEGIAVLLA